MADLRDVERRIAEIRAEIEPKLKEIEALEQAARVLRSLEKGEPVVPPRREFTELTMPEAARQILLEITPIAMHYKDIAKAALDRGFKGKRVAAGATFEQIASSFRRM